MSEPPSDLRRVLSASGIYAFAAMAQRGLAFLLLPIYTRYIDPVEYGLLELLTAFATVVFNLLMVGQPSAIMKCFHRDCESDQDRARLLPTSLLLEVPVLLLGAGLLALAAPKVGPLLTGDDRSSSLVLLVLANGVFSSVGALALASLRARERPTAFSLLTIIQFAMALSLNIVLVVNYGMGVRGVLIGNLVSNVLALPLVLAVARKGAELRVSRRLLAPLGKFGLLLVPVVLSGWIIDLSDRYLLRILTGDLAVVAVYGVGYKLGRIIELVVVWPFQLAWPAVSFSISRRPDHRQTYARTLTYLTAVLAYLVIGLSLLTRVSLQYIVGDGYLGAYRVVPIIALAYAFNGVQYCVSPAIHVSGKTRYLTYVSVAAALVNIGLNFLLIPAYGMMGAAWATVVTFCLIAGASALISQRFHSVPYEYLRLAKVVLVGAVAFFAGELLPIEDSARSFVWHLLVAALAFPLGLVLFRFFEPWEGAALRDWSSQTVRWVRGVDRRP